MKKVVLLGFICGALAAIIFHQGTQYVLYHQFQWLRAAGVVEAFRPATHGFSFRPVPPSGIPQVLWLAMLGGIWGIVLAALIRFARLPDLLTGVILGGVVWTVVDFTLGAQIGGGAAWAGANAMTWWRAVVLNTAWGWGCAFLMRPFSLYGG